MPPSEKELREACDLMQALLTRPLPAPKRRAEMFQQIYRVLRRLLPEQAAGELQGRPTADGDSDLLDDPLLKFIQEVE